MTSLSSCSSSLASTQPSSFFAASIADTSSSAPESLRTSPRPEIRSPLARAQLPSIKNSLIHLPLELPSPPEPLPEAGQRLVLDDDIGGAPVGFVVHRLRALGPELLKATTETCLFIPPGPTLPQYLRCTLPPFSSSDRAASFRPSHILGIRSSDSSRTLLLPVHGLLFAAASPPLSILSSKPEKQPPHPSLPTDPKPRPDGTSRGQADLPIIEVNVPSSAAFPLLQGWIYLRSPSLLLSSLLPASPRKPSPPSPYPHECLNPPSSLSRLLNPTQRAGPGTARDVPPPPRPDRIDSRQSLVTSLAKLPPSLLLEHVHLVHNLWGNVVCLEVSDEELWKTLRLAWKVLVGALALRERDRQRKTSDLEGASA